MKYRELIRLVQEAGWRLHRQSGSHMVFRHAEKAGSIVIAGGGKLNRDVPVGTENAVLRQAGIKER